MKQRLSFVVGIFAILVYWYFIHPIALTRNAYIEDMGVIEVSRHLMADNLREFGSPVFTTTHHMWPFGNSVPFLPWSLELNWIGAWVWNLNSSIPWIWIFYGLSLLATYLGVGLILKKMKFHPREAWVLSAIFTLINIPRNFKVWYHPDALYQHWIYWSVLIDVWLMHDLWKEKKWNTSLEVWRAFFMVGMLGIFTYFWGPMILEWVFVRLAMLGIWFLYRQNGTGIQAIWNRKQWIVPIFLGTVWFVTELRWFLPLFFEIKKHENVQSLIDFYASLKLVLLPVWIENIRESLTQYISIPSLESADTVVTVGWIFWIPALLGSFLFIRNHGKKALLPILPFFAFIAFAIAYIFHGLPLFHEWTMKCIPFFFFFRTASRFGLLLPLGLIPLILITWSELKEWFYEHWNSKKLLFRFVFVCFAISSLFEILWVFAKPYDMPPLNPAMTKMLENIRQTPGTAIVDLPFCIAGGNGYCTVDQCPQYPYSTVGESLREWHNKDVMGLYTARYSKQDCQVFNRDPFIHWFEAWRDNRCFTGEEWKGFCSFLESKPELSGVLLYPEIWSAVKNPECLSQFKNHLGDQLDEASISLQRTRGGKESHSTKVLWFKAQCQND